MDKFIQFLKEFQTDKKFKEFDEASIKQAVILKILSLLGWDPFDFNEIQPEYSAKKQKIDFALKNNGTAEVFIIVKKGLDNFKAHIETLLASSEASDVKIAIYTNGLSWWFFLPYAKGSIDEKRFAAIDAGKEKADLIAKKLHDFISKENVVEGRAVELAEEICNKRKEAVLINEHLPKAWEKILNEPEKYLIGVISEVTKDLCGYKPKQEKVVEFIKAEGRIRSKKSGDTEVSEPSKISNDRSKNGYKGKDIKSFYFEGNEYPVKSWQELPWELCRSILKKHRESFENVVYITLKGRDFFSNNPYQFILNKEIPGTGIFINTDLSEAIAVGLCNEILKLFGYEENNLLLITK